MLDHILKGFKIARAPLPALPTITHDGLERI